MRIKVGQLRKIISEIITSEAKRKPTKGKPSGPMVWAVVVGSEDEPGAPEIRDSFDNEADAMRRRNEILLDVEGYDASDVDNPDVIADMEADGYDFSEKELSNGHEWFAVRKVSAAKAKKAAAAAATRAGTARAPSVGTVRGVEALIGKTVAQMANAPEMADPSVSWSVTAGEIMDLMRTSDTYSASQRADLGIDDGYHDELDEDDAVDGIAGYLQADIDAACQQLDMTDALDEFFSLSTAIARRLYDMIRAGEFDSLREGKKRLALRR